MVIGDVGGRLGNLWSELVVEGCLFGTWWAVLYSSSRRRGGYLSRARASLFWVCKPTHPMGCASRRHHCLPNHAKTKIVIVASIKRAESPHEPSKTPVLARKEPSTNISTWSFTFSDGNTYGFHWWLRSPWFGNSVRFLQAPGTQQSDGEGRSDPHWDFGFANP